MHLGVRAGRGCLPIQKSLAWIAQETSWLRPWQDSLVDAYNVASVEEDRHHRGALWVTIVPGVG